MYNMNKQNPTITTVRKMLTAPLFLVAIIGYSAYGLFQFIGAFAGSSISDNLIYKLMRMQGVYGLNSLYYNIYGMGYNFIKVVTTLIGIIPVLLIITGMWMLFVSVKTSKENTIGTAGLTMIRVIVIIRLVALCISVILLEIGFLFLMKYANPTIMFVVMILVLGIASVGIIYYVKLSATIQTMKITIFTGVPNNGISQYLIVICYIMGGVSALMALVALATLSLFGLLSNAGLATSNIVFAIYLSKYRINMDCLIQNPNVVLIQQKQAQYQNQNQQAPQYQRPQPQNIETTLLDYYNETSVLSGQMVSEGQMKLIRWTRQKTGEIFCINKDLFWIGKVAEAVDYCITDNTAISRRHVLVSFKEGSCFIRDNHSTNRVFLNGRVLPPDTDIKVSDGDRVRLADEEFIVNIE